MTRALATSAIAALYLAAVGSASPVHLAIGVAIGFGLSRGMRPGSIAPVDLLLRLLALPRLALATAWRMAAGCWTMTLVVLGLRSWRRAGIVELPIGERTPLGVSATGWLALLSPGSLFIEVDETRGVILFHVIDASDPDAVRASMQRSYQREQRRVLP